MAAFRPPRNRDAWFVIRGYKYQVDLTIIRWLALGENQVLILESGEDIDIVGNALGKDSADECRELEQVKHLDSLITLNSPACKTALANAVSHFRANPSQSLFFRFCTNAAVTTERPPAFQDRQSAIDVWESLRRTAIAEPDRTARLQALLVFLRDSTRPSKGVDDRTWSEFIRFMQQASVDDLNALISRFEWSTQLVGPDDISDEIVRTLEGLGYVAADATSNIYPRLFLHVVRLLSHREVKQLDKQSLGAIFASPVLTDADGNLLSFLKAEVLDHAKRLEALELADKSHEAAISELRARIMQATVGPQTSLVLSNALADVSTRLPPSVRALAARTKAVSAIASSVSHCDWFAIYGSVGCGKTQLAALLGEHLGSVLYVSLRDLNTEESVFLIHNLFLQLCGGTSSRPTTTALAALVHGAAIIFDDVPRLVPGDQLGTLLAGIADHVRARGQRLITLSHHTIPPNVVSTLQNARFDEIPAPPFDSDDVTELFSQHGAPQGLLSREAATSFAASTSGSPTLLAAIARHIKSRGWNSLDQSRSEGVAASARGEIAQDTMLRLLKTVENIESRDLLYRLCVVSGAFCMDEVTAVSSVKPTVPRPLEAYQALVGLWVEKQTENDSVVCPLISSVGAGQLTEEVEQSVAATLAGLLFKKISIAPLDFVRAIGYLKRARNGPLLGARLLQGLESVIGLPQAWRKLIYFTTNSQDLLQGCPTSIALLIKAKQVKLAQSIDASLVEIVREGRALIAAAGKEDQWAVLAYGTQAAPIVAESDLDEGLRLIACALDIFDDVIAFKRDLLGTATGGEDIFGQEYKYSLPWFVAPALRSVDAFMKWFRLVDARNEEEVRGIFASDLAREGFKLVLDRLWMMQHDRPERDRDFGPVLAAYDEVVSLCRARCFRVFEALAVRSQIIVYAEYLKDLQRAASLAEGFLESGENDTEMSFLINEVIGRQFLYAGQRREAAQALMRACNADSGTFDGLRCRALVELSRAIGDEKPDEALSLCERAVSVSRRSYQGVSELDVVSCLGEAAIAAGLQRKYGATFDYLDQAYVIVRREFKDTLEWKMRAALLGNTLGYFFSMAYTGEAPASDYAVPARGQLLSYNEAVAKWYDEADYKKFDFAPTLLVIFANSVAKYERARYWANKGIDDARAKGVLTSIYSLGEALIPRLIEDGDVEQALDYAFESATALVASVIAHTNGERDIREGINTAEVLGIKPSKDWNRVEESYLLVGVIPSIIDCCVRDGERRALLHWLATDCATKAENASNPRCFSSVLEALTSYLGDGLSSDFHQRALAERAQDNAPGAIVNYLLSSFSRDADLRRAVIQHAVVMHHYSLKIPATSPMWTLLTDQLLMFWRRSFKEQRFRFSGPMLVEESLERLQQREPRRRIGELMRTMLRGLSVRLPDSLVAVSEWLRDVPSAT